MQKKMYIFFSCEIMFMVMLLKYNSDLKKIKKSKKKKKNVALKTKFFRFITMVLKAKKSLLKNLHITY